MSNESSRHELPFAVSFLLSFVASALTTLAICEMTTSEPLITPFLKAVDADRQTGA